MIMDYVFVLTCQKIFLLNKMFLIETNKVKKEHYLIRLDNTIYQFSIKFSFSSMGQDQSKLQKQIS